MENSHELRLDVAGIYCHDILTRFIGEMEGFIERLCGMSKREDHSLATPTPAEPRKIRDVVVGVLTKGLVLIETGPAPY